MIGRNWRVAGNAFVPRSGGFGGNLNGDYPYVGNGFAASLDGHLTPEWRLSSSTMMEPDVTIMSFRNADGSPRVVSMGGAGESDRCVLRQVDPSDPQAGNYWEPQQ